MTSSDELWTLMKGLAGAMAADPGSAELRRAWKNTRAAYLRQAARERGEPDPPPKPPRSERRIRFEQVADDFVRDTGRILEYGDKLSQVFELISENRDALGTIRREQVIRGLEGLAARASARADQLRRSLP